MNIFFLDKNPRTAAKMACDRHVVKMIVESAQMLSTAHRILDGVQYIDSSSGRKIKRWKHPLFDSELYKASHINHPSTVWAMNNRPHYLWLFDHMIALNEEFKLRYQHIEDHLTIKKLGKILSQAPLNISDHNFSDPTPAMPVECEVIGDVVASYRKYYNTKKRNIATWKSPAVAPDWFES